MKLDRIQKLAKWGQSSPQVLKRVKARSRTDWKPEPIDIWEYPYQLVEAVKTIRKVSKTQPFRWLPWHYEYFFWLGCLFIRSHACTGAARVCKTAGHQMLFVDLTLRRGAEGLYTWPREMQKQEVVGGELTELLIAWLLYTQNKTKRLSVRLGWRFDFGFAIFKHLLSQSSTDGAFAASQMTGFNAWFGINDEVSQLSQDHLSPVASRLQQSPFASEPVYNTGTPGGGGGIELFINECDTQFYPFNTCPQCENDYWLDPCGTLLLESTLKLPNGKEKKSFYTQTGKPNRWNYRNESDPIETAYFKCPHCDYEIQLKDRINARFKCRKTGVLMLPFLEEHIKNRTFVNSSALELSPLLRDRDGIPRQVVHNGFILNPADWQQQQLGKASSISLNKVTLELIDAAIDAPRPGESGWDDRLEKVFSVFCSDWGNQQNWGIAFDFYLTPEQQNSQIYDDEGYVTGKNSILQWKEGIRVVKLIQPMENGGKGATAIAATDIKQICLDLGIDLIGIDNEPSTFYAAKILNETGITGWIMDQQYQTDMFKDGVAYDGASEHPCLKINFPEFMLWVLHGFESGSDGFPLWRFPREWKGWKAVSKDQRSPYEHFQAPIYDPSQIKTKQWDKDRWKGKPDHLYYTAMFGGAALLKGLSTEVEPEWEY